MPETTSSTLSRVANVLGVADKFASKGNTPIDNILKMQHFTLWGFIVLVVVVGLIIWLVQKKLDSIDKQYKEQYILLHRLFKSHQDLQVKVHVGNKSAETPHTSSSPETPEEEPDASAEDASAKEEEVSSGEDEHNELLAAAGVADEPQVAQKEEDAPAGFRDSSSLVAEDEDVDTDAY